MSCFICKERVVCLEESKTAYDSYCIIVSSISLYFGKWKVGLDFPLPEKNHEKQL